MDSQGSANSMAESASGHGEAMVKPNAPLPQQSFQARPQGPPPSPRNSINNGPVGAPRPGQPGQPLRRLDSRSTLGPPPVAGQPAQLRPYGPPRPPGGAAFPPRPPQPGQLPPQNQRFAFPPGVRGPPPQAAAAGQRPPFVGNQQAYQAQQQQQQQQRISNDPRFQRPPDVAPQNGPRRPSQESVLPRQLSRNDSLLTLQRQQLLSNEELKQPTRPRIVIEKMADINEITVDKPEGYLQRKKSDIRENGENDDDDDVVMDSEKSSRHNGTADGLMNGSKSPSTPRRLDDTSRPDTATIKDKEGGMGDKHGVASRPTSAMEVARVSTPVISQSRPSSAMNDDKEEGKLTTKDSPLDKVSRPPSAVSISEPAEVIKISSASPYHKNAPKNIEHNLKPSDTSRSATPSRLDAEQELKTPASGPDAERETLKTPSKTPDRSRSSTPAGVEASSDEAESAKEGTLQVKQSSRPASSLGSPNSMKDGKLPKSPRSLEEDVKGFDNGQQRSLSSNSPRSPNSPNLPAAAAKPAEGEKKRASFVEDARKDAEDVADKAATSKSTAKTPRAQTPSTLDDGKREKKSSEKKAVHNGGTSESNGVANSPTKQSAGSPTKSPSKSAKSLPRTPDTPTSTAQEKKKLPMNKIQVGAAPSPNLKVVRSKIGSLDNASYKPGGGKVKIENRKLDFGSKAQPKIAAKNDKYMPSGGDKKIAQVKLQWNAKSKVGSLDNATYKPGGGDKKIETVKLDFKDKAKPKVGSKDNAKHVPGGGAIKSATPPKTPQETKNNIPTQKVDIKAESKIGSLDNVKHKPGGGDKKIFNDRDYLRQTSSNVESVNGSGSQARTPEEKNSKVSHNDILEPQPPPSTPTKTRSVTPPSSIVTPQAVRSGLAKSPEATTPRRQHTPETEGSTLANGRTSKTPSPDAINDKNTSNDRSPRSPITPRPPSSLRVKSAGDKSTPSTPRKTSPNTPRASPLTPSKTSPGTPRKSPSSKELHLPKIAPPPIIQESSPATLENHVKISLPKLMEPASQTTRMAY